MLSSLFKLPPWVLIFGISISMISVIQSFATGRTMKERLFTALTAALAIGLPGAPHLAFEMWDASHQPTPDPSLRVSQKLPQRLLHHRIQLQIMLIGIHGSTLV
jgi:hypothetical protein